jgi:hypothetical protein
MIAADLGGFSTHNLRDQETRCRTVPVGGASETGEMNETGEALSRGPFRDIFMIAEVLRASSAHNFRDHGRRRAAGRPGRRRWWWCPLPGDVPLRMTCPLRIRCRWGVSAAVYC